MLVNISSGGHLDLVCPTPRQRCTPVLGPRVVTRGSAPVRTEWLQSLCCLERSTPFLSQKRDTEEAQHVSSLAAG